MTQKLNEMEPILKWILNDPISCFPNVVALRLKLTYQNTLLGIFLKQNGKLSDSPEQSRPFLVNKGLLPKAHATNCFYFATGAQNTVYKQRKNFVVLDLNLTYPIIIKKFPNWLGSLLNSPVQLRPSPVYPVWHSHTYDPTLFVQLAFLGQRWFPSHSSASIRS